MISLVKIKLTLLTREQVGAQLGLVKEDRLKVLQDYGRRAMGSDLVLLLGGIQYLSVYDRFAMANSCCRYWIISNDRDYNLVWFDGSLAKDNKTVTVNAIRPVLQLPLEMLEKIPRRVEHDGITRFYFGEYPQMVAERDLKPELERKYRSGELVPTGKFYTFRTAKTNGTHNYLEYYYDGEKYVIIVAERTLADHLSNDLTIRRGTPYYFRVDPIVWLYDEETRLLISERGLVAGIPYHLNKKACSYEESQVYQYLNNYLAKQIIPSEGKEMTPMLAQDQELQKVMFKKIRGRNPSF